MRIGLWTRSTADAGSWAAPSGSHSGSTTKLYFAKMVRARWSKICCLVCCDRAAVSLVDSVEMPCGSTCGVSVSCGSFVSGTLTGPASAGGSSVTLLGCSGKVEGFCSSTAGVSCVEGDVATGSSRSVFLKADLIRLNMLPKLGRRPSDAGMSVVSELMILSSVKMD